jgi:tight adherence protein C
MTIALVAVWVAMAAGLWLVSQAVPTRAAPALVDRVVPYLGRPQLRDLVVERPVPSPSPMAWPRRGAATVSRLTRLAGSDGGVTRRLETLGGHVTVEQFRLEQLAWGVAAAAVAMLLLLLRGVSAADLLAAAVVVGIAGVLGMLARDRALTREVSHRDARLRTELPTMVEMLAMSVAAGSGLLGALDRVSRIGSGVMAAELDRVLSDVRVGLPLIPALQRMAGRNELVELRRFVEAVTVSVERGTPLADVLVAQAADAREAERRALIESGGRKEIAMMVPVVFLVLPLSVVFVLFPGFYGLQLGS